MGIKTKTALIIVIFLLLNQILIPLNIISSIYRSEEEIPKINNVGVPSYHYNWMTIEGSKAYLFSDNKIDVMDISVGEDIKKVNEIYFDYNDMPFLDYYFHPMKLYCNFTNNRLSYYIIYDHIGAANRSLVYREFVIENDTLILDYETQTNITINCNVHRNFFFQEENSLFCLIQHKTPNNYTLYLTEIDIANKSEPIVLSKKMLFEEIDDSEATNNYNSYIQDYNSFDICNNYLFFSRGYFNVTQGSDHVFLNAFMKTYDISNTSNPIEIDHFKLDKWSPFNSLWTYEDLLFHTVLDCGFLIYDISNPYTIQYIAEYKIKDTPTDFLISDDILYITCYDRVEILDISNIQNIIRIDKYVPHYQGKGGFIQLELQGDYLYVTRSAETEGRSFYVFDITNNNLKRILPEGIHISPTIWFNLVFASIIIGPIIGVIIIVTMVKFFVRKRKKKKQNQ